MKISTLLLSSGLLMSTFFSAHSAYDQIAPETWPHQGTMAVRQAPSLREAAAQALLDGLPSKGQWLLAAFCHAKGLGGNQYAWDHRTTEWAPILNPNERWAAAAATGQLREMISHSQNQEVQSLLPFFNN